MIVLAEFMFNTIARGILCLSYGPPRMADGAYPHRLCIVRCYSFDPSVAPIGAVGGRRWTGRPRDVRRRRSIPKYDTRSV